MNRRTSRIYLRPIIVVMALLLSVPILQAAERPVGVDVRINYECGGYVPSLVQVRIGDTLWQGSGMYVPPGTHTVDVVLPYPNWTVKEVKFTDIQAGWTEQRHNPEKDCAARVPLSFAKWQGTGFSLLEISVNNCAAPGELDLKGKLYFTLIEFLRQFNGQDFRRVVKLGDEALYRDRLYEFDLTVEVNPALANQASIRLVGDLGTTF